jgi:hypothetical protein
LPTYPGALAGANLSVSGNVTGAYILGNGSQLTGLPASYSNAQVAAYLASGADSSNIITTANISGAYILGNGSQLTGLPAGYSNAQVSAYLSSGTNSSNIITTAGVTGTTVTATGNVVGGNLTTAGQVSATGNITGNYLLGNGSQLTGLPATYSNANVQAYLPTYSGNIGALVANGNIQVVNGIFIGNGAGLTGVIASGNVGAAQKILNGTTELNVPIANGNIVGNIGGVTNIFQFSTSGLSVNGNVTANYFIGHGSALTGLPAASSSKFGVPNKLTRSRWLVIVISLPALAIVVPAATVPLGVSLSCPVATRT